MKRLSFLMLLVMLIFNLDAFAQDDKKQKEAAQAEAIKNLVESKSFVFHPESASPLKGGMIHLSPGYSAKVAANSIDCDLPYYGQASSATIDQTNTGFKFTSSSFEYKSELRKKGGWDITAKTKDVRYGPQLYFTIQTNGATNLRISSNDRQSISYLGVIEELK